MGKSKWREVRLGEICMTNLKTYSIKENWDFINYLDTGNITKNKISEIQLLNCKTDKIPSRAKRIVEIGDIIYSTVRPNQQHYGIIKDKVENLLVSTGFTTITINADIADNRFIYFFLIQQKITDQLQILAEQSTSTYPSIKPMDIEDIEISIPPLPTQQKIASILSALDDKIELNQKINDNLEQQAQALFKSWFVDFEPFQDGEFIESELGMIPKGWRVCELGDVTTQIKDKVKNEKVNVLSPINSGELVFSEDYFTKQVYSKDISNYIIVKENDFAYNPARINIGSIGINNLKIVGCVS